MNRIIECIPNFSEGRDLHKIQQITDAIESVPEVKLLHVEPGKATNRTVVTFVGVPELVVEAAFRGIKKAAEVINMAQQHGEHPRFGATDVCPLVPVANISMDETIVLARQLAERVGKELQIPVYCYEFASFKNERKSLANCRAGEYEGLRRKITSEQWRPDFGPNVWTDNVARSGAVAIGARNFLVAYNINLNTPSIHKASIIASDIRESGRIQREGNPLNGKIILTENGNPIRIPGSLKKVRAIGWYIEEYGIAQVSLNLTDISITPVHIVFDEVCKRAADYGVRVTGSEIIGLIPLKAVLDAGKYFLLKQQRPCNVPESELISVAVKSLGLDELAPFDPKQKIIEYAMANYAH